MPATPTSDHRIARPLVPLLLAVGLVATLSCGPRASIPQVTTDVEPHSVFHAVLVEPRATTPNISMNELDRLLTAGVLLLDNRPFVEFALGHIPGARNVAPKPGMPMSEYTSDVAEVGRLVGNDRSRPIVLYCAGPFCGKSARVADELLAAGYTSVRRFQLGAPVWRALGRPMVVEAEGIRHVLENDRTARLIDARAPEAFGSGSIPGAINVREGEVRTAKDDGRLPMEDHNTRIIVVGAGADDARALAEELARNAFHNVGYFEHGVAALRPVLAAAHAAAVRVTRVDDVRMPVAGELTQATVHETDRMVSRIMRLAPGASIAEHHHPFFDETFVVQSGTVRLLLDGRSHDLRAGDVVHIPAGTVITGTNAGSGQAAVVVTWATTGRPGPLTIPGRPAPHH